MNKIMWPARCWPAHVTAIFLFRICERTDCEGIIYRRCIVYLKKSADDVIVKLRSMLEAVIFRNNYVDIVIVVVFFFGDTTDHWSFIKNVAGRANVVMHNPVHDNAVKADVVNTCMVVMYWYMV